MAELTFGSIDKTVLDTLRPAPKSYWVLVALLLLGVFLGAGCWVYQIFVGIGVGGQNNPVHWGIYLVNFVFWVGIAHSGTLISAILHLFRAGWRNPIARAAETMTIFAVCTAGLFPFIHLGRVWLVFYMLPVPNSRELWPNFTSPLMFDVVAISTYLIVSALFWYTGMLPDLATVRDRAMGNRKKVFHILSLGWTGAHEQWRHYARGYLFFAALATPLVISVHSVVSWDFALGVVPGWHTTIFAPYFVAGAIHSGLAMVLTLMIPLRKIFHYESIITVQVLESVAKTIVFTGLIVGFAYGTELFIAWYSRNIVEMETFRWRMFGDYGLEYWIMVICNTMIPLLFLFKKIRSSIYWLFGFSLLINVGMWYERFVIIIGSVAHDYIPYTWGLYWPTAIEIGIMLGSFCLFFFLFVLFVKHMPSVSMTEMKETLHQPETEKIKKVEVDPRPVFSSPQLSGPMSVPDRQISVMGLFNSEEQAASAICGMNNSPWTFRRVHSPIPSTAIMDALGLKKSRVGWFTLAGGIAGFITGFSLAVFTATRWDLIVGGKPVIAWVPFFIVGFEFTILFAVIGNIVGLMTQTGLPQFDLPDGYDPACSSDRFGVLATCDTGQQAELRHYFLSKGAEIRTPNK
jgi:molybdopterin-containing oxidoreductase family membrane subunit